MRVSGGNSDAYRGKNPFRWEQFDALPKLVRDVIDYAPLTLGTERAWLAVMSGARVEDVARREIGVVRRQMPLHTQKDYGPSHPSISWDDALGRW